MSAWGGVWNPSSPPQGWQYTAGGWWQWWDEQLQVWETLPPGLYPQLYGKHALTPEEALEHAKAKRPGVTAADLMREHGMLPDPAVEIAVIRAATVKVEKVTWLWPGRIPMGKLTVLDGDPGLGKSCITLDLTARVTTASPMPDGHRPDRKAGVLLLSAEDGVADTIVPRLKAHGADLELVTIVDHVTDEQGPRPPELPADLDRLQTYLASLLYGEESYEARLVVVDPLMAFLGDQVNSNRDQDVRRVLYRLKLMAEQTGCAVVVVRHLNKAPGANPLYRGGGSIGIIGAARAGLLVGIDPDDDRRQVLAVAKSNLAAKPSSLAYRIVEDPRYGVAKVVWDGTSEHTAADLLGRPVERAAPKLDAAETFLRGALAKQNQPVAWLQKAAKAKGISWDTVKRAKEALEVIVERRGEEGKRGGGAWWWRLPAGQLQIKESTTNISPDAPLNEAAESAGQAPDSESPAIKESIARDDAHLKPRRIQLHRTKGWRLPEGAVSVARPSRWGNPYQASEKTPTAHADAVELYRKHLATNPDLALAARRELRGKDLACWCPPDLPCHADVLLELASWEAPDE